jgi:hypothetical protein
MRRQKKISIKAFECVVLLMITDNVSKAEAYIHKKYKTEEEATEEGDANGLTIGVNFNLCVIILDHKTLSYNLVGHEVCHAVQNIVKDRDITDEETMAWLTGYLCEEVHTFANKIKNETKKQPKQLNENVRSTTTNN